MKLIRDLVPGIITASGETPVTHTAKLGEFQLRLRDKLGEEVREYLAADPEDRPGELADLLEVVRTLALLDGVTPERLEDLRAEKHRTHGGFASRTIWAGNQPTLPGLEALR